MSKGNRRIRSIQARVTNRGEDLGGVDSGAAYVALGPVSGTMYLSAVDLVLEGETDDDDAGGAVAFAGDVNGDGFDDILVGAEDEDTGGLDAGAVYLVLGEP